jgi:hypothetical protein
MIKTIQAPDQLPKLYLASPPGRKPPNDAN